MAGAAVRSRQHVFFPTSLIFNAFGPWNSKSTANNRNQDSDGLAAQLSQVSVWSALCAAHNAIINLNELYQRHAPSNPSLASLQTQVFQRGKGVIQTEGKIQMKD